MRPRLVVKYRWSRPSKYLEFECDADFGGCHLSRKSTSSLFCSWSGAFIKFTSKTQTSIALSTQESEFYSIVSCVATALGLQQLFADVGVDVEPFVYSDASAGISLCKRVGLGASKHINVQFLWVQKVFRDGICKLGKVDTNRNRSDLGTKFLEGPQIRFLIELMGMEFRDGRHPLAFDAAG